MCNIADDQTGLPVNVSSSTPRLKFKALGSDGLQATVIGAVVDGPAGQIVFYPASAPEMLQGQPGDYVGEIEITFQDGQIQTVYDLLKFKVREDF